jgi:hypothetical protein
MLVDSHSPFAGRVPPSQFAVARLTMKPKAKVRLRSAPGLGTLDFHLILAGRALFLEMMNEH